MTTPGQDDPKAVADFERLMRAIHLTSTEVVDVAWAEPSALSSQNTAAHLVVCPSCQAEVAAVRNARPAEIVPFVPETKRFWKRVGPSWLPPALAATLLVGLSGALLRQVSRTTTPEGVASSSRGTALQIEGLMPTGEAVRESKDLEFSWSGDPRGRYGVTFMAEDGDLISHLEITGLRLRLRAEDRAKLESEPVFFWKVDPLDNAGAVSGSRILRVAWRP